MPREDMRPLPGPKGYVPITGKEGVQRRMKSLVDGDGKPGDLSVRSLGGGENAGGPFGRPWPVVVKGTFPLEAVAGGTAGIDGDKFLGD